MTVLRSLIAIALTLGTLVLTDVRDARLWTAWSVAAAIAAATLRPRPPAIPAGPRVRTRSRPSSIRWWRNLLAGVAVGLLMSTAIIVVPRSARAWTWLHERWQDRDRAAFEVALAEMERGGRWQEAAAAIEQRLQRAASLAWRAGLEGRRYRAQLEDAVCRQDSRPALVTIRQATRMSDVDDRLAPRLIAGLDAEAEVRQLREQLHGLNDRAAAERLSLVMAHLSSLIREADEFVLHPGDARSVLDEAQALAAKHNVSHDGLKEREQAWRPPRTLPEGTRLAVAACTQRGPICTLDVAITKPDGEPVSGLTMRDFRFTHERRALRRFAVWPIQMTQAEFSAAIAFDHSASTAGAPLQSAITGLSALADSLSGQAHLRLWTFGNEVRTATAWTATSAEVVAQLRTLKAEGRTALMRAMDAAAADLTSRSGRRLLIVFTDGKDTVGGPPLSVLIDRCRTHDITLYAVALQTADLDLAALQQLTEQTGGQLLIVDRADELIPTFQLLRASLERPVYRVVLLTEEPARQPIRIQVGSRAEHTLEIPSAK